MAEVTVTADFDVSVEALWDLLGDFGDMNKWAGDEAGKCVAEGNDVGSLRTIHLPDGREIVDRLEEKTDRSYTYTIVSSPLPFSYYRATMSVEGSGEEASRFTWHCTFEASGIPETDAIQFTENMYAQGIALMRSSIARQAAAT